MNVILLLLQFGSIISLLFIFRCCVKDVRIYFINQINEFPQGSCLETNNTLFHNVKMDIASLQPKYIYGLRTNIKNNVHHITEEDILYPNGGILILHNFVLKKQKYLKLPEKGYNVNLICVSPNKKVIAVAEIGDPPSVSLYDAGTLKRKKHLQAPPDKGITTREIECMAFTSDFKSLLVVFGEPDWLMVSYKYDRGKIESVTRANNLNNTGTVRQLACNPADHTLVVLIGDILFRMLAATDNIYRQFGYSKAENLYLRSACWLSQERLLAGTSDGKLMVIENGELKMMIKVEEANFINFQHEELALTSATILISSASIENLHNEITGLQSFPKGFFLQCGAGQVYVFEKETPTRYKKRNLFILEPENVESDDICDVPSNFIHSMSLSPTQDYLIVSSKIRQLFYIYLWGLDITRQPEIKFQELGPSLHRGGISCIAVCEWKPILITVGIFDRFLKIWNYETNDLVMSKKYQEDIYGVSLHPTGLYTLVGFSGKLRFLTILIEDFAVTREFNIRYCAVCSFSTQGHLFAAVNGNVIQIYSSISFDSIFTLKGHNGKITDISWVANDYNLLSCGTEGTLYTWDLLSGKRIVEVINKTCQLSGCHISKDGRTSYTVDLCGEIKEVINGVVRTVQPVDENGLDCIVLSNSDQMLFISGKQGNIFSVKLPLTETPERFEYMVHNTTVPQLRVSFDDNYLISCSVGGTFCIWKLINTFGKAVKIDKDYEPSVDILIPYVDLAEKLQTIKDLNLRMCELDREHAYQLRNIDQTNKEKMEGIHDAYKEVIDTLRDKNSVLESEHTTEIHNINMEIIKLKRDHDMTIENVEATYNEKLINEYNKYVELEDKICKLRKDYDAQIEQMIEANRSNIEDIEEKFKHEIHNRELTIDELKDEIQQLEKDHEVIKQQIEDDADREIYELKSFHEEELKEEQSVNIRLRAENGIFQKKLNASTKEIEELKHTIFTLENEHIKFKTFISGLEKDISELKKEIIERDETIQGKEKKIYDMKKKTQELEKYKIVLDFEITEFKAQIEPRERKIHDQKEEIQEMIIELENLQSKITQLDLQLAELREKLSASHHEFKREQIKFRQACDIIKQMRTDLHYASGLIQEPNKLKTVVRDMFHKYNADKEFNITRQEDCDSKNEFSKQRHYLEKSIGGLKRVVAKRFDKNEDKLKMMDESTQLISEVNILRGSLKIEQKKNKQMESVLGISKKTMQPREAQRRLSEAVKTREDIRKEYEDDLKTNETCIRELRDENIRLTEKLSELLKDDELHDNDY